MPTFFDRDALTPEQQERWDRAFEVYERVRDDNIDRELATMTPLQRERVLQTFALEDGGLREAVAMSHKLSEGGAGHPKSALFARLLDGKPALPCAPPVYFAYPWYEAFDNEVVSEVHVEFNKDQVLVGGTPWQLVPGGQSFAPPLAQRRVAPLPSNHRDLHRGRGAVEVTASSEAAYPRLPDGAQLDVTFGAWAERGWSWTLYRDRVSARRCRAYIVSWHDPELRRITTFEQLQREAFWHVDQMVEALSLALSCTPVELELARLGTPFPAKKPGVVDGDRDRYVQRSLQIRRALPILKERRAQGLPDLPRAREIDGLVQSQIEAYLAPDAGGGAYEVDKEDPQRPLWRRCWSLRRRTGKLDHP